MVEARVGDLLLCVARGMLVLRVKVVKILSPHLRGIYGLGFNFLLGEAISRNPASFLLTDAIMVKSKNLKPDDCL